MTVRKKALVTGCCGFIGSNLVHRLVKDGWFVDGVDDMSNGHDEFLEGLNVRTILADVLCLYESREANDNPDVLLIQGDFAHENVLNRIKDETYDVIFHLAANPRVEYSVQYPVETTETNVLKTVALFHYAIGNVDRVVFSSSAAVYGNIGISPVDEGIMPKPASPYALQKRVCEDYARLFADLYGLEIVSLRYFNVYGPGQLGDSPYSTAISAWCHKAKLEQPLRSDGDGEQTRDLVFVDDVVDANMLAANAPPGMLAGGVFNIATGRRYSNNEILAKFKDRVGAVTVVHAPVRQGDVEHSLADIKKAYEVLGYSPSVSIDEGLEKTLKWWEL
jgi:UDP-glucose 4-epimerase